MKRRAFLKSLGVFTALIAARPALSLAQSQSPAKTMPPEPGVKTIVALAGARKGASDSEVKSAVRAAANAVTDFSWLSKGDAVFIKPALNSGLAYPSTTSPVAIGAMIELLKQKGAGRVIVGDMSGIEHVKLTPDGLTGSTRRLMASSGMAKAVAAAGGENHFFEEAGWNAFYEDEPCRGSHWKRGLMMPNILKAVDHIVLMPRCARHVLTGSTLGLKAAVGYWRTDTRLEYHHDASTLHEKTAEGNTVATLLQKQRLVLSAADKVLTSFGPDEGRIVEPDQGLIMASTSVVAHDMVALAWLLENRLNLKLEGMDWIRDHEPLVARVGNHYVVHKLGGWRSMLSSEKFTKHDLNSVKDDRVLNRACHVLGGVPHVTLIAADSGVPDGIRKRLAEKANGVSA
ncbi:MAG: DUF362 domain-containing protein [Deltaproteobacteria bacterium]|nr:DUF362 domain-containing protein [Deltaproteobacteria bacterium]